VGSTSPDNERCYDYPSLIISFSEPEDKLDFLKNQCKRFICFIAAICLTASLSAQDHLAV